MSGCKTEHILSELAEEIQEYIKESMPIWKEVYPGVE